ncbi:MAG: hypothetical protein HQ490_01130 [Lutibacter sp.]|nr:hypothetical protein [Lutibacter sp.]
MLKYFIANPNNIGCHTTGKSEEAFKGSQELEKEVIRVFAVDIFKAEEEQYDGYIATGGTEANIQALWIYRNKFKKDFNATLNELNIEYFRDPYMNIVTLKSQYVSEELAQKYGLVPAKKNT